MDTIKSSADISELFSHGRRIHTPYMTVILNARAPEVACEEVKQHGPGGRVAFIAGKKLGNAVWRNGAKRRLRALCRDLGGPWPGYDVIFLAKSSLVGSVYSKVLKACESALDRSELR